MVSTPTFAQAIRESAYGWESVSSYYDDFTETYVTRLSVSSDAVEEALLRHEVPLRLPGIEDVTKRMAKIRSRKGLRWYGRRNRGSR